MNHLREDGNVINAEGRVIIHNHNTSRAPQSRELDLDIEPKLTRESFIITYSGQQEG